jgi:outer membrane protein, multidrug efflux system
MRQLICLLSALAFCCSCTLGPGYKRPPIDVPDTFRASGGSSIGNSIGDEKWWELFQDEQLQGLIRTALGQNYDVRIAATRVLEARAQLGITRGGQYPAMAGGAAANNERLARSKFLPAYNTGTTGLDVALAWDLDFWGKYRRATEAARAELLATEWARREVISTLVSNVASAYFQLRALDLEQEISKRTLAERQESLRLIQLLADHGSTSLLDVRQAEQLVYTASEQIPDLSRQIEQQENLISTLLGRNPTPVVRGLELTKQPHPPVVPSGLPSFLLERRPDIREAEEQLIAFNAQIGIARAAYFPDIQLTAVTGVQSTALTNLFGGPAGLWNFGATLTQPIFTAGRIRSGVRLAEAQRQEAVLVYQETIQEAFREVSDALVAYRRDREFRAQQELLTHAAQDSARLSDMRYRGGAASYLEVLTNDTNYFSSELALAQARLNELLGLVQLYHALGGGWQA